LPTVKPQNVKKFKKSLKQVYKLFFAGDLIGGFFRCTQSDAAVFSVFADAHAAVFINRVAVHKMKK